MGGEAALIVRKAGLGVPEPHPRGHDAVIAKDRLHDIDRDPEIAGGEIDAGGRAIPVQIALQGLYGTQELGRQGPLVLLAPGHEVGADKPGAARLLGQQKIREEPRPFQAPGGAVPLADEEAVFIPDPGDRDRRPGGGPKRGVPRRLFRDPEEIVQDLVLQGTARDPDRRPDLAGDERGLRPRGLEGLSERE